MKLSKLILLSPALLLIGACTDSSDFDFDASVTQAEEEAVANAAAEAVFNAAAGLLPSPNNLAFLGMQDGTLNISLPDGTPETDPRISLNTLDGFSTIEPISTTFSLAIDPDSLIPAQTVRVFEMNTDPGTDTELGAVTSVERELAATEFAASVLPPDRTTMIISPLVPLKPKTTYMFLVTRGVTNDAGTATTPSTQFLLVAGATPLLGSPETAPLEPVRLATFPLIQQAEAFGVDQRTIAVAWSMRTQSTRDTLETIKEQVSPVTPSITSQVIPSPQGVADIRAGTIALPYYRTAPASINDPVGASSFWTGPGGSFLTERNPMPVETSTQTVPLLVSFPNGSSGRTMPEAGWPVAMFIHGVGGERTNMFAVADRMAVEGFAVVAVDQPMHGLTDTSNLLYAGNLERTFNLDLIDNATRLPGPDGITDDSGAHYFSLATPLAARDNLRQAAADLMVLSASVGNITADSNRIDASNKTVIGHSLGGTVAATLLAFETDLRAATLGMPAAGLARMLIASNSFGPPLIAGLAANGLEQGTPDFESFVVAFQTVLDPGDPINHAAAAAAGTPIHIIEVVGDGTDANPSDQTVPNNLATAPLAGTDPLATVMGLPSVTATTEGPGLVRFSAGGHSSLLDPTANGAVTIEMQGQMAIFASNSGNLLQIDNTDVISDQ